MEENRAAWDAMDTGTRKPFRNIVWEAFTPTGDDRMRCIFGGDTLKRTTYNAGQLRSRFFLGTLTSLMKNVREPSTSTSSGCSRTRTK
jgi:hypothetical protein